MIRLLSFACVTLLVATIGFGLMWRASERQTHRMVSEVHRAEDRPFELRASFFLQAASEHVPVQKITELTRAISRNGLNGVEGGH